MSVQWSDEERAAVQKALTIEPVGEAASVIAGGYLVTGGSIGIDAQGFAARVLDALAPFVAAREAQALRDAADRWDALQTKQNDHYSRRDAALWLHNEADRITQEAP